MHSNRFSRDTLGDEPPLLADGRRVPDRREISLRWLSGTCLTGLTSCALMGMALFAALDGREQLAIPGQAMAKLSDDAQAGPIGVAKGGRIVSSLPPSRPTDKEIMEVSTVVKDGDRDVVRRHPFAHINVALAANHTTSEQYPEFDPLEIFAAGEGDDLEPVSENTLIYGAQVESEITLMTRPFPLDAPLESFGPALTAAEAEETVRSNGAILTGTSDAVASLHYVDPQRFASLEPNLDFTLGMNARVVTENVSIARRDPAGSDTANFAEEVLPVEAATEIETLMVEAGYGERESAQVGGLIENFRGSSRLESGQVLRLGLEQRGQFARLIRASLYSGTDHILTLAENDRGFYVRAAPPVDITPVANAFDHEAEPVAQGRELPTVYDGIYRAALAYGMNEDMTRDMVRVLASDVDYQARLRPSDRLEAFFSVEGDSLEAGEESELLFINAKLGSDVLRFYRFRHPEDGTVDYYDAEGRSARQFLIRNPVPNGRFSSSYGMRRHPILGYRRMHAGVDWSAPTGTPIIAAADGVVESAGWHSGGFGRHTEIRHANGYTTTYSHQSSIAKGISPGAAVKQGQVIGYVGSTGLSTGPHLHYEMSVNGSTVDPMRVRLPDAKALEGDALAAFRRERDRINDLLGYDSETEVASR